MCQLSYVSRVTSVNGISRKSQHLRSWNHENNWNIVNSDGLFFSHLKVKIQVSGIEFQNPGIHLDTQASHVNLNPRFKISIFLENTITK
jgi:hypothetical protein